MAKNDTGLDLKIERTRVGATQREVGRKMGISAARVSVRERSAVVDPDTAKAYRAALAEIKAERESGRSTTARVLVIEDHESDPVRQYVAAKAAARAVAREDRSIRRVNLEVATTTPAAQLLGWIDGLEASGVLPVVLDTHGTMLNRRTG